MNRMMKKSENRNDNLQRIATDYPELFDFMSNIAEEEYSGHPLHRFSRLYRAKEYHNDFRWEILFMYTGTYKFCERVQRHHKQNNIYFLVDMRQGTYRQKCHDDDCKNFQGEPRSLPSNVTPWLMLFNDEWS